MATENLKRETASQPETLTEQEMQELELDTIQNELEEEDEGEEEHEAEGVRDEIEEEALAALEMADVGFHGQALRRALIVKLVLRTSIRAVRIYTRIVLKRMLKNTNLRKKLLLASRRGPKAVRMLLGPAIIKAIPKPFRTSRKLVVLILALSYRRIARQAGLPNHEIEAAELEAEC